MKKLLIICLALIVFLTSCDLSYFKNWGKTPDTEVGGEEGKEEEAALQWAIAERLREKKKK